VYVTVEPEEPARSELETRAYCRRLAQDAVGPDVSSGDEVLDQLSNAYGAAARDRYYEECLAEQGF
jgi:hypothetical protein